MSASAASNESSKSGPPLASWVHRRSRLTPVCKVLLALPV